MVKNKNKELIDKMNETKIAMEQKGLALNNKFLPVHCVVTRDQCPTNAVLQDGFVILPSQTKFHEIINIVLQKLEGDIGKIDEDEHVNGEILIKNWNPLSIETVTENPSVTIQEILGELMNIAVLQIHISKYANGTRTTLYQTNATLDYDDRSDVGDGEEEEDEEEEEHRRSPNGYSSNSNTNDGDNTPLNLSKKLSSRSSTHHPNASTSRHLHLQIDSQTSASNRRQRERTTFDPHEETPRLLQIFTDTKHPTRYQIASICETLNALPCRKGKKALEPYNIQYWFKNARAALKRRKRHLIPSDLVNGHDMMEKTEFESSDDDEDEENIADDHPSQNILPTPTMGIKTTTTAKKDYYSNYLQAFDISLGDPQKSSQIHSDESQDGSGMSEQSPSIPFTPTTTFPSKMNHFDYNRSRRNRIFIDPSSEVPKLEQWFAIETHPDHILIERICSELNEGEYRRKFPKLESKHIRLWFKNHRAKVKRLGRVHQISTNSNDDEDKQDPLKHFRVSSSTIDDN